MESIVLSIQDKISLYKSDATVSLQAQGVGSLSHLLRHCK
jgi:hypothetical protein